MSRCLLLLFLFLPATKCVRPPKIVSEPSEDACLGMPYHYDADDTAEATGGGEFVWSKIEGPDAFLIDPFTGFIRWTPDRIGEVPVEIGVENSAGRDTQSFEVEVACCSEPPRFLSTPETRATVGSPYHYDEDDQPEVESDTPVRFTLNVAPEGMVIQPQTGRIEWTPSQAGTFTVIIVAANCAGHTEQSFRVSVDPPPPFDLDPVPDQAVVVGETLTLQLTVTVQPGTREEAFRFEAEPLLEGMTFDTETGLLTFRPTCAQIGESRMTFSLFVIPEDTSDPLLVDQESAIISVLPPDPDEVVLEGSEIRWTSLAIDPEGRPHIAFHDGTNGTVGYATFEGCVWMVETIASDGGFQGTNTTELALSEGGIPYVFFYDAASASVRVAAREGDAWQVSPIDGEPALSAEGSLRFGPDGLLRVAYGLQSADQTTLKLATLGTSGWSVTSVLRGGGNTEVGRYPTLRFDGAGRPRIMYLATNPPVLTTEAVSTTQGAKGTQAALHAATGGGTEATFTTGNVEGSYLQQAAFDGASWRISTVDGAATSRLLSFPATLEVQNDGISVTAYLIGTPEGENLLKFAFQLGNLWQDEVIVSAFLPPLAMALQLRLTPTGIPVVVFRDQESADLVLAYRNLTTWNFQRIDERGNVGFANSLAIDSNGTIHITYVDAGRAELKYRKLDLP
ncbi:MAG: hypothetical protein D6795_12285 [Deltaproteobacteria bacterium]|nr:MAG: hypothetical protein D6795_12285 [Deltaproteobacteria bacterium]